MIEFIRQARKLAKEAKAARRERKKLWDAAMAFNTLHTYARLRMWMCPKCNRVHTSTGYSGMTGLLYPACCDIEDGHRQHSYHATKEGSR